MCPCVCVCVPSLQHFLCAYVSVVVVVVVVLWRAACSEFIRAIWNICRLDADGLATLVFNSIDRKNVGVADMASVRQLILSMPLREDLEDPDQFIRISTALQAVSCPPTRHAVNSA